MRKAVFRTKCTQFSGRTSFHWKFTLRRCMDGFSHKFNEDLVAIFPYFHFLSPDLAVVFLLPNTVREISKEYVKVHQFKLKKWTCGIFSYFFHLDFTNICSVIAQYLLSIWSVFDQNFVNILSVFDHYCSVFDQYLTNFPLVFDQYLISIWATVGPVFDQY